MKPGGTVQEGRLWTPEASRRLFDQLSKGQRSTSLPQREEERAPRGAALLGGRE